MLHIEYLIAENRILRDQIKGRLQLSGAERQTLAEIGKKLGKKALEEVATIVKPGTILGYTQFFCRYALMRISVPMLRAPHL